MLCKIREDQRPVFILTQTASMNMLQIKLSVISMAACTDGERKGDPEAYPHMHPICTTLYW
jgi:hypothetical protein